MSAFEDFVQVELPKRPYLNADVPQNSIIVRQGAGPRQLSAVTLQEGQVLTVDSNGDMIATTPIALVKKFILTVGVASEIWNLNHNLNSENVIVQCFDENKSVIIPDTIQILDANSIRVTFEVGQIGIARVLFLD